MDTIYPRAALSAQDGLRRTDTLERYPEGRFVVLDFETTGLSPFEGAKIIEVSAREIINGKPGRELCTLVDPEGSVPAFITDITGISTRMVRGMPRFSEIIDDLCAFIDDAPLVAHNAAFDVKFLSYEAERQRVRHRSPHNICTLLLSRRIFPGMPNYKLGDLGISLGIMRSAELHRASADTFVTAKLFEKIYGRALEKSGSTKLHWNVVSALQNVQKRNVDHWLQTKAIG